jgi:VTC domain
MKPVPKSSKVLERYELKFTIPFEWIDPITDFARTYCHFDRYSTVTPSGFYQVNSLYLDTPDFFFLRQRINGAPNRFNMRVRSYGPQPELPYFLEVKQKCGDIVRKYRAALKHDDLRLMLDVGFDAVPYLKAPWEANNLALFKRLVHHYNAAPVAITSYRRKALFSHCDDYARVTFDIGMCCAAQKEYLPFELPPGLAPTDMETLFDDGTSVVLELKCYSNQVPLWMVDLIRAFGLNRRGYSKYSSAMMRVFGKYQFDDSNRMSPLVDF